MIAAFTVRESFSFQEEFSALQKNLWAFAGEFAGETCEFFYYLKPNDANRFFFIRAKTRDTARFVEASKQFAENLDFGLLPKREARQLLNRIDLNTFV